MGKTRLPVQKSTWWSGWKLNESLLEDKPLRAQIKELIESRSKGMVMNAVIWEELKEEIKLAAFSKLRILRLLLEVRLQNRDTHQLLSQLDGRMARLEVSGAEAAPPPPVFAETSLPRLPAMTVAELEGANEKKRLINMGGKKPTEVGANIVKAIMTLPGQVKSSLHGNKGKRPFISMGLCTLALGEKVKTWKLKRVLRKKWWSSGCPDLVTGEAAESDALKPQWLPRPKPHPRRPPKTFPQTGYKTPKTVHKTPLVNKSTKKSIN
ncbi:hypothetical protein ISCGN_006901 [Ixodes scapularis]